MIGRYPAGLEPRNPEVAECHRPVSHGDVSAASSSGLDLEAHLGHYLGTIGFFVPAALLIGLVVVAVVRDRRPARAGRTTSPAALLLLQPTDRVAHDGLHRRGHLGAERGQQRLGRGRREARRPSSGPRSSRSAGERSSSSARQPVSRNICT